MERRFKHGLVVGKFCPLHKGHELLIERALAACERLTVISYTKPEFEGCGRVVREGWLRSMFPQCEVLVLDDEALREACLRQGLAVRTLPHNDEADDVHREFVGWICLELLSHPADAVFTSEDYGDGFAAFLSRYFEARLPAPSAVTHVCVDQARREVPVSGTAIRAAPHLYRDYMSPAVTAAFVQRVAVLGGESSGKTSLARALAAKLSTEWVAEYGRERWERQQGRLAFGDMLEIARTQLARELDASLRARQWLICDTSPLTTLFYSLRMFGAADPALHALATTPYSHVVLCAPDFPFVQDGTRQTSAFRDEQHQWYLQTLEERGIGFQLVSGNLESRIEQVVSRLM